MSKKYLIVDESLLPPYYSKVALAKELIAGGGAKGVSEAVNMVGISRSTFYKYRDMIEDVNPINSSHLTMFSVSVKNEIGALASLLGIIAGFGFNIWTISSNPPIDYHSKLLIILESKSGSSDFDALVEAVKSDTRFEDIRFHGIA